MTTTNQLTEKTWNLDIEPEMVPPIYLPSEILDRYISVAMRDAIPRQLEDGAWYADLPRFPGVWANGISPKNCLDTLEEILREWLILKIADVDRDIPIVDDIDLTKL